ncbi:phosphopantetheine-binding protein, partial [Acinetobacter baumannii]
MASGKIDRKRLPLEMLEARESRPQKPEQPLSITERKLLEALAPLFPGADVGATSDFFDELGGHSLLMARFASALRQRREFATV